MSKVVLQQNREFQGVWPVVVLGGELYCFYSLGSACSRDFGGVVRRGFTVDLIHFFTSLIRMYISLLFSRCFSHCDATKAQTIAIKVQCPGSI